MSEHEQHEQEAREQLASRIEDMRLYLDAGQAGVDVYDESIAGGDLPPINEYGLEWTKYLTNHIDETVTYRHVLSTGGPHDEFQVTFDPDKGTVESIVFVYLPWFDRVEIGDNPYEWDEDYDKGDAKLKTVSDFYETFYGEYVQMEAEQ